MVEVTREKYPLNQTLKLVTPEGRATSEFFRVLKAIGQLIGNITIEDGEVTTDMIAAGAITAGKITVTSLDEISTFLGDVAVDGDLIVGGTITTGKVATNAITDITVALQVGSAAPSDQTVLSSGVPITSSDKTGVLINFTGFMDVPSAGASNAGYWGLDLYRNGVKIDTTGAIFYDDNFSYQPVATWVDETPGVSPSYSVQTFLMSGDGNFTITNSTCVFSLFKR